MLPLLPVWRFCIRHREAFPDLFIVVPGRQEFQISCFRLISSQPPSIPVRFGPPLGSGGKRPGGGWVGGWGGGEQEGGREGEREADWLCFRLTELDVGRV